MIAAPPPLRFAHVPDPPVARVVDLIVIHCSATPSGKPLGAAGQSAVDVINAWHAARGFRRSTEAVRQFNPRLPSIGYHYVVDLDGTIWTGRHLDEVPAQAAGFNERAVGICLVGGVEREARYTRAQWASLAQIGVWLLAHYGLPAAAPLRKARPGSVPPYTMSRGICGHRDLSPDLDGNGQIEPREFIKTCPGFSVADWLRAGMQPLAGQIHEG